MFPYSCLPLHAEIWRPSYPGSVAEPLQDKVQKHRTRDSLGHIGRQGYAASLKDRVKAVMVITLTMTKTKLDPTERNKSIFCNRLMERRTSYEKESFVARFQVKRQRDGPREVNEPYGRAIHS
jgi:hypothetical protein